MRILMLVLIGLFLTACAGDAEETKEPVSAADDAPSIPDIPGQAGETEAKPAGDGAADAPEGEIVEKSQPNMDAVASTGDFYVNSWVLNVRGGPGMRFDVVRTVERGQALKSLEQKGIWVRIGENEWVSNNHLSTEPVK